MATEFAKTPAPTVTRADAEAARTAMGAENRLPDAGFKRDDEFAKRKDALAQQAEELANARQLFALKQGAFDEQREIQVYIQKSNTTGIDDYFAAENLDYDHYEYKQVQCLYPRDTPGRWYTQAKLEGWQPCTGREINLSNGRPIVAPNRYSGNANFDDALQIGDLVLMSMERYRYEVYCKAEDIRRDYDTKARQGYNLTAQPGTIVHQDINDPIVQRITAQGGPVVMAPVETVMRQELAKSIANVQHNENIRTGQVPGLQPGA